MPDTPRGYWGGPEYVDLQQPAPQHHNFHDITVPVTELSDGQYRTHVGRVAEIAPEFTHSSTGNVQLTIWPSTAASEVLRDAFLIARESTVADLDGLGTEVRIIRAAGDHIPERIVSEQARCRTTLTILDSLGIQLRGQSEPPGPTPGVQHLLETARARQYVDASLEPLEPERRQSSLGSQLKRVASAAGHLLARRDVPQPPAEPVLNPVVLSGDNIEFVLDNLELAIDTLERQIDSDADKTGELQKRRAAMLQLQHSLPMQYASLAVKAKQQLPPE